ncbi:MAG: cytochrome C oxidase subunit IV family protein [Rhodospirillaceae bacterium]
MMLSREYRRCAAVWLALIALLAVTCASAFLDLGPWNSIANLGIAAVKVLLVALFFMHLKTGSALIRIYAVTAVFALSLLFALSFTDYETRVVYHAPWQQPHADTARAPNPR